MLDTDKAGGAAEGDVVVKANTLEEGAGKGDSKEQTEAKDRVATDQGEPGTGKKSGKKKKNKKKGKKFVPLPVLVELEEKLPWKLSFSHKLGRHGVAKRDISAGEVVLVEHAIAAVPRDQFASVLCHWCFRKLPEIKMMVNSDSQQRALCSKACKEAAEQAAAPEELYQAIPEVAKNTDCDAVLLKLIADLESMKVKRTKGGLKGDVSKSEVDVDEFWTGENERDNIIYGGWDDVRALVSHWDKMPEGWRKSVTAGCKALRDSIAKSNTEREAVLLSELQELAAIVNMNAHGLGATGVENTDVALGLFPVLSLFNHSCRPNCCFNADGPTMIVRAVQDIKEGDQMCVSYINLMEPRWMRHKMLLETRFFACSCKRCSEDIEQSSDKMLEGVQCPKTKCQGLLVAKRNPDSPEEALEWKCQTCSMVVGSSKEAANPPTPEVTDENGSSAKDNNENGVKGTGSKKDKKDRKGKKGGKGGGARKKPEENFSAFDPQKVVDQAQESLATAMTIYNHRNTKEALEMFEGHLKQFEGPGKLGPYHVCMFDALTPIMNCYRRLGDPQGSLKYCQKVINAMEAILQIPTAELGNFYQCMAEVLSVKAGGTSLAPAIREMYRKQAQEAIKKAVHVRKICCGVKHPATQDALSLLKKL